METAARHAGTHSRPQSIDCKRDPTSVITTPFPPDDSSVGYERGVAVSKAWDEAATQAAIEAANHVVKHLDQVSHGKPTDTNRAASPI